MNGMKTRTGIALLLTLLVAGPAFAQVSFGNAGTINGDWRFTLSDVDNGSQPGIDDSEWQRINLPHDWSVREQLSPSLASCTGYLPGGIGWYRKSTVIPAGKSGRKIYLYFEGVYNRSEVFINGHSLGSRPNGYISFMYDATPYVNFGGENLIAVRVDHSRSADSRWYSGSGIYRNVWLIESDPIHIAQWGVYAVPKQVSAKQTVLGVRVTVENGTQEASAVTVDNHLTDPDGQIVARSAKKVVLKANSTVEAAADLTVRNPLLWDLESPHLYTLTTRIVKGGEVIDQTETRTGLRNFTFDPDRGFALNGRWMKIKGVCLHHDAGTLGSAVPRDVWKRRLETLKEIGCNAVRTSHNPQAPELYDLCDELGILVMDEAYDEWRYNKRKWISGWNAGTPGLQGTADIFAQWGETDLADLVRRDRNHPSVFAWSIGNEVDYPNDPYSHPILDGGPETGFTQPVFGGYKKEAPRAEELGEIAQRLAAEVRKHDTSRPVTAGLAGVAMSNETGYPGSLDIAGYNYTESRYLSDHEKYPQRVIYGSENRHDPKAWRAVTDNRHIFGQFLWTGIDYLGESGAWPSRGFYSGLLDFGGFIKPRGYFRKSLWSETPMAYIGTYPVEGGSNNDVWSQLEVKKKKKTKLSMDAWPVWNYKDGEPIRVVCYTNARKARLLLDGQPVGAEKPYDEQTGIIHWDIPYSPGLLSVEALDDNGQRVACDSIRSSGRPYALQIDRPATRYDRESGIAQIVVRVTDRHGVPVMISDNEVTCTISGRGELLGMEAGNNTDMSDYTDNKHRVFLGRLIAYVKVGDSQPVTVEFTSPWLTADQIRLEGR